MIPLCAGLLFGFFSAIPVAGPLSALILARSMAGRYRSARGLAFGVAGAEAVYAAAAWWGAAEILVRVPLLVPVARGVAALLLLAVGAAFAAGWPRGAPRADDAGGGLAAGLGLGLGLGAINPTFLASWSVVATAVLSSGWGEGGVPNALAFGLGAGLGTAAWFGSVPSLVRRAHAHLPIERVRAASRATGWVLVVVALGILGALAVSVGVRG